jgi:hypothetical protein
MALTPAQIVERKIIALRKKIAGKNAMAAKYLAKKLAKQTVQAGYVTALLTETVAKKIASLNKKNDAATQAILKYNQAISRYEAESLTLAQALAVLIGPF